MCEICLKDPCDFQCPNYVPPRADYYCAVCGEGIYPEEKYIRNDDGETVHLDCIIGDEWLINWLGYQVETC